MTRTILKNGRLNLQVQDVLIKAACCLTVAGSLFLGSCKHQSGGASAKDTTAKPAPSGPKSTAFEIIFPDGNLCTNGETCRKMLAPGDRVLKQHDYIAGQYVLPPAQYDTSDTFNNYYLLPLAKSASGTPGGWYVYTACRKTPYNGPSSFTVRCPANGEKGGGTLGGDILPQDAGASGLTPIFTSPDFDVATATVEFQNDHNLVFHGKANDGDGIGSSNSVGDSTAEAFGFSKDGHLAIWSKTVDTQGTDGFRYTQIKTLTP